MKQQIWLFILFLLLPTGAFATSFEELQQRLIVNNGENQYRLRATTKPFQLASIDGAVVEQFKREDEVFSIVNRLGNKTILKSTDGISYQQIPGLENEPILDYLNSEQLLIRTGSSMRIYANGRFENVAEPLANTDLNNYLVIGSELLYVDTFSPIVRLLRKTTAGWQSTAELTCAVTQVTKKPFPVVLCDGIIFKISENYNFLPLSSHNLVFLSSSEKYQVLTSQTEIGLLIILADNELIELNLPISNQITSATIFGDRIFINVAGQYYEIDYRQAIPQLYAAPISGGELVSVENATWAYLRVGSQSWLTRELGNWQAASTVAEYNRAKLTSVGLVLWKYEGSDIQFSSDGHTFLLQNGSWARSAKFKDLVEFGSEFFLLLLNSSLSPNIYRTKDINNWTRITLPTKPTHRVTISQAREALPDTLVELFGVISVAQGVVSDEVFYLQDNFSGIQIFLSKTKGSLSEIRGRRATVTAEISSSQTKRAIIESPDEVELGEAEKLNPITIEIADANFHLGELVSLSGESEGINQDYFILNKELAKIKAHLIDVKDSLNKGDNVSFSAITDWNSASGVVEAWVVPESLVISPKVPEATIATVPVSTGATVKSSNKISANSSKEAAVVAAATKKITPISDVTIKGEMPEVETALPSLATTILVSIGLLLMSRGRRVRKLVESNY